MKKTQNKSMEGSRKEDKCAWMREASGVTNITMGWEDSWDSVVGKLLERTGPGFDGD